MMNVFVFFFFQSDYEQIEVVVTDLLISNNMHDFRHVTFCM